MIQNGFVQSVDVWAEVFCFFVAMFIAAFSLRTYVLTKQRKHFFFAAAFGTIAAGIIGSAIFNYFVQFENLQLSLRGYPPVPMNFGILLTCSTFLILAGFMTIFIINSELRDKRAIIMLFMMTAFASLVAHESYLVYHLTAFILVGFIFSHYLVNYEKQHTKNALLVLLAFTALLVAEAILTFIIFDRWFYLIGNLVRLLGFILFLLAIIMIYRKR